MKTRIRINSKPKGPFVIRQPADANPSRPVRQHSGDLSAHTPGPWTNQEHSTFVWSKDGNVCVCGDPRAQTTVGYTECDVGTPALSEAAANASLIAAAPDMLAALEVITAHAPDAQAGRLDHFYEAVEVCRAAIAKATGEA